MGYKITQIIMINKCCSQITNFFTNSLWIIKFLCKGGGKSTGGGGGVAIKLAIILIYFFFTEKKRATQKGKLLISV